MIATNLGIVQRNEKPFARVGAKYQPVKGGGGWPDFSVITAAGFPSHWVECKVTSEDRIPLGDGSNAGVSDSQAETMYELERLGHRCWVALRWEVPDKVRAKSRQVGIGGRASELPYAVQRLVPWPQWGALRFAAALARLRGEKVEASVGLDTFAGFGLPLNGPQDIVYCFGGNQ